MKNFIITVLFGTLILTALRRVEDQQRIHSLIEQVDNTSAKLDLCENGTPKPMIKDY